MNTEWWSKGKHTSLTRQFQPLCGRQSSTTKLQCQFQPLCGGRAVPPNLTCQFQPLCGRQSSATELYVSIPTSVWRQSSTTELYLSIPTSLCGGIAVPPNFTCQFQPLCVEVQQCHPNFTCQFQPLCVEVEQCHRTLLVNSNLSVGGRAVPPNSAYLHNGQKGVSLSKLIFGECLRHLMLPLGIQTTRQNPIQPPTKVS